MRQRGFTLVEMVMTIVILGIIAGILTPMIKANIDGYRATQARSELMQRGRVALARLERELHDAIPNSLSILASGTAIEFVTSRRGGAYLARGDDRVRESSCSHNDRFTTGTAPVTPICLLHPNTAPVGVGDVVVIGNRTPLELRSGTTRGVVSSVSGSSPLWRVAFSSGNFANNSPGRRFAVVDRSHEIGLVGSDLRWRTVSGMSSELYDNSSDLTASDPRLASEVSALQFNRTSDDILLVTLTLTSGDESITFNQQIYVKNAQ
jgi:MSHA biogenesis protein MshO